MHVAKNAKIYVAGHTGLVGSSVVELLTSRGYSNLITATSTELDLRDGNQVSEFFANRRPQYVVCCAGKVGGIAANNDYPADFIYDNLAIATNVIQNCYKHSVERVIMLGSSCIYPRDCPQPIREEHLLTGPLEPTNRPYAVAKIAALEMCWAYNRQFNTQYLTAMPTNLYGVNDNFDVETSHVLPALLRKFHIAKLERRESVSLWGTGKPLREFLYVADLADALLFLLNLDPPAFSSLTSCDKIPAINIGSGEELTIDALAQLIASTIGYEGRIVWDTSQPDGTPRKRLCTSQLEALGWHATTSLKDGLERIYHCLQNDPNW